MYRVLAVAGTRPELIKLEPVISAFERLRGVETVLMHSGQHMDMMMFEHFLEELGLVNLKHVAIKASSHHDEDPKVSVSDLERTVEDTEPDIVLAVGDTYTVAFSALISHHAGVPFGHVEAGLRSFDPTMPEEGNRIIADHLASICFAPTSISAANLAMETIPQNRIEVTGNTIVDACLKHQEKAEESRIVERLGLDNKSPLILLTVHRVENTDDPTRLGNIVETVARLKQYHFILPIHPRTRDRLRRYGLFNRLLELPNLTVSPPLGYADFLKLLSVSEMVVTDSGGVQEEATILGRRCLVLRETTERPETVISGSCRVVGIDKFGRLLRQLLPRTAWPLPGKYRGVLGDGRSGMRIAKAVIKRLRRGLKPRPPRYLDDGFASFRLLRLRGAGSWSRLQHRLQTNRISILQIYDRDGRPYWPRGVRVLQDGMSVLVLGCPSVIETLGSRT
ncbi:UDP-N-acetylglucosamine 2-epimerase (non-hydrolyzing) [Candidatus Bathyarchaeota archaeon]|nr:UDP-N-acetylglucosamine 2-epimerase (non-hydrolyzing) [Candidatus Bathyarchaeota archaeon]